MGRRRERVSLLNRWKSIKKNARRNVKKKVDKIFNSQVRERLQQHPENINVLYEQTNNHDEINLQLEEVQQPNEGQPQEIVDEEQQFMCNGLKYVEDMWEKIKSNWDIELAEDNLPETAKNEILRESILCNIKLWASKHSITHMAIRDLMKLLNEEITGIKLPTDGRTVMETPRKITIVSDDIVLGGKYWHYGLHLALHNALTNVDITNNMTINLTINIDGLPLYNSSRIEFWPILVKIGEYENIPPLIIGIFCGDGKYITMMFS